MTDTENFFRANKLKNYLKVLFFSHLCKALAAVYRSVFTRLEWNLSFLAARSTDSCEHFTLWLRCILSCVTACLTSLWFIYETLRCIKFLFASCENKFFATFLTDESLVFVHLINLALVNYNFALGRFCTAAFEKFTTLYFKLLGHIIHELVLFEFFSYSLHSIITSFFIYTNFGRNFCI